MALDLGCLTANVSLPDIPSLNGMTSVPRHPPYNPNGWAISQRISSSMARSTFSIDHMRSLLTELTAANAEPLSVSKVTAMKPVRSTIVYVSVTLALFIIFSVMFVIVSCVNCCRRHSTEDEWPVRKRKCSKRCVSLVALVLIGSVVAGQLIYVAYQVDRTTKSLDSALTEFNQEIYPKEVIDYLQHILEQFRALAQYSAQKDSLVVVASRSMLVGAFDHVLRERYFVDAMQQLATNSTKNLGDLDVLINQQTGSPPVVTAALAEIRQQHHDMINQLSVPLEELCNYAGGTEMDIDATIMDALSLVNEQLTKMIELIEQDFLADLMPGESAMLINAETEKKIHYYVRLVGIILIVLVIIFGLVPLVFFLTMVSCRYRKQRQLSKYRADDRSDSRDFAFDDQEEDAPPTRGLCWMRIVFMAIVILLILIVLLSSLFYAVDLFAQGACRTAHDDQSFLVPFLIDKLLGSNSSDLLLGGLDVHTTVRTILDDCASQNHFSRNFFSTHLVRVGEDVGKAMSQLNGKVNEKFTNSIQNINVQSDLQSLETFATLVGPGEIQNKALQMRDNLQRMEMLFQNITGAMPTIPTDLVNVTIDKLNDYVHRLLQDTTDTCPLPLGIIYTVDKHVCHEFAGSINGLWFSLFLYMLCVICGLCLCGLCIYQRL